MLEPREAILYHKDDVQDYLTFTERLFESVILKFCIDNNIEEFDFDCHIKKVSGLCDIRLNIKDLDIINDN